LIKSGEKSKISENDEFNINGDFSSKLLCFSIPLPDDKDVFIWQKIEVDWSGAVEAAIVKILKSWKQMNHNDLVAEVMTMLATFKPNIRTIKERITHLISREFIEWDLEDNNLYKYVA